MGYKTFNVGDVLTASDVMTYLMNQAVIDCTSGSRPSTWRVIYETDTNKLLVKQGSTARRIPMDSESGGPWSAYQAANDTSSSITYVAGTDHGVAFVAPPSGKVYVSFGGGLGTNAVVVSVGSWMSFEVRNGNTVGSGTVFLAADDSRSTGPYRPFNTSVGTKYAPASQRLLVTGLTAGADYNVRTMFRSDNAGAQAAVHHRQLVVEPVL